MSEKQRKRFGDLKVDEQFILRVEICIQAETVFQKYDTNSFVVVGELVLEPDTEVEVVE